MTDKSCPICGRTVNHAKWEGTKDTVLFDCPRCGTYEMPGLQRAMIPAWFRQSPEFGPVLSHYIRVRNKAEKWPMIGTDVTTKIEAEPSLPTPAQQADSLVLFLGDSLRAAGEVVALDEPVHGAIIGSRNDEEFRFIVASMKKRDLVEAPQAGYPLQVTLSFAGWARLDELRQPRPAQASPPTQSSAAVRGGASVDRSGQPPRAFVSHASEDKDRFVVRFATRLRANGVEAWLDQWEMHPGDSLIAKIFDRGIAEADCVIVVLSRISVTKPWVREELESAMVRSIQEHIRVIPLLIDECDVPEVLRTRFWVRIADLQAYDEEFNRLLGAIFQHSARPPLGPPPAYAMQPAAASGLDARDAIVLAEACRLLVEQRKTDVSPAELLPTVEPRGLDVEGIMDSAEVLAEDGLVEVARVPGVRVAHFAVTPSGIRKFARSTLDVARIESEMLALIVNKDVRGSEEIAAGVSQPEVIVHALLHGLAAAGLEVRDFGDSNAPLGRRTEVVSVSPRLRRRLG